MSTFEPKWTAGPWRSPDAGVIESSHDEDGCGWGISGIPRADADLIALAPEMAEAILDLANWDCNCEDPYSREHHSKLDCSNLTDLAARLRMIGSKHD